MWFLNARLFSTWHIFEATTKKERWTIKLELLSALWFATCLFPIDLFYFKLILVLFRCALHTEPIFGLALKGKRVKKNLPLCFRIYHHLLIASAWIWFLYLGWEVKVKEQLGALQLLSYPKATSSFCHSRKKENLLTVAWEWKYCSLIVMEVLIRLKIFSGQSLFFIKVAMSACLRKISQTVHHHLQSVALRVLILEKLCCVLSVVLPLPDLFPPLFAGWGSFYIFAL